MKKDNKEVSHGKLSSMIIGAALAAMAILPINCLAANQNQTQVPTQNVPQDQPVVSETVQQVQMLEQISPESLTEGDIVIEESNIIAENDVEVFVDVPPIFPGGQRAIYQFLSENIDYPESAINDCIEGTVMVKFAVETNGSVSNVEVAEGTHSDLDNEAVRVVSLLPDFKPAICKGHPVRVFITMPILFMLDSQMKGLDYDLD